MGTWPISKKNSYNWSEQNKLSFDKISPHDFYFFLSFQSALIYITVWFKVIYLYAKVVKYVAVLLSNVYFPTADLSK